MSRTRKVMAIMFGVVLAVIAVGAFAGIAIASAVQGTAAKIIQGDTVNCPISQVQLVNPGSTNDAADLARFLTGFLNEKSEAYGRPVGVAVDATGALLVADDVGNTIWRVSR